MTSRRNFLSRSALAAAATLSLKSATPSGIDVRAHGATGDGKTLDTAAINKAIDAAVAAGGGTVIFPAGNYLSHSIHLKSNVALYLDAGCTIVGAGQPAEGQAGFDLPEANEWDMYQDFGHSHFHNSLLWAESIENVSIVGPGRIWGKGLSRGAGQDTPNAHLPGVGNKSIALKNCHNVLLRDFSILHGGHFGILATGVDNLTIDNLKIDTNRDGMDIDACRNVRVSNCFVNSPWDDGICLKADYALGRAKQCEYVTITNCYVSGCWEEGTMLDATYKRFGPEARVPHTGRIKFGTESNGGFRNITISNCVFEGCQGLALETVDGALLEDVTVTNISMRDITTAPIFMRLGRRMRGPDDAKIGTLKRVIISDLVCSGSAARVGSVISGIPGHEVEDVKISNIEIVHEGGGTKEDAAFVPPEYEDAYPEPNMFMGGSRGSGKGADGKWHAEGGPRPANAAPQQPRPRPAQRPPTQQHSMPSHGFFVRHVNGIQFDNIEIRTVKEDLRPAFVLQDVEDAEFFRIKVPHPAGAPIFALHNVKDFEVERCTGVPDTKLATAENKTL